MFQIHPIRSALGSISLVLVLLVSNIGTAAAFSPQKASQPALPSCEALTAYSSSNFPNPTQIDNPYDALVPGTQFILDGSANIGGTAHPHRIVITVTDLVKDLDGITTRVIWETDSDGGQLMESELAFQAQDNAGNVWVLGEYPEEYNNGNFSGAPSTWISGIDGATAGVLVPGNPQEGTPAFMEGSSPNINFLDCGLVTKLGLQECVQGTCYDNVMLITEWSPLDSKGGIQQKYYANGKGNIKIGALNDPEGETMELTSVSLLNPTDLAAARDSATSLDQHGQQVSDVYRQTPPVKVGGAP